MDSGQGLLGLTIRKQVRASGSPSVFGLDPSLQSLSALGGLGRPSRARTGEKTMVKATLSAMAPALVIVFISLLAGCSGICSGSDCQCPTGESCDFECPEGNCNQQCDGDCEITCEEGDCDQQCSANADCQVDCEGGGCEQQCSIGATCNFACSGGNCTQSCLGSATCTLSCSGGNCTDDGGFPGL